MPYHRNTLAVGVSAAFALAGCTRDGGDPVAVSTASTEHVSQCLIVQAATGQATAGLVGLSAPGLAAERFAEQFRDTVELGAQLPPDAAVRAAWQGIVVAVAGLRGQGVDPPAGSPRPRPTASGWR